MRLRVLAVVARFKWQHIDYLRALAERFDLDVVYCGEGHSGSVAEGRDEGLMIQPLGTFAEKGAAGIREALRRAIEESRPDVIHVMYYLNEELTLLARELAPPSTVVVHECRDPLTTLRDEAGGSAIADLERRALAASDAQILVSTPLLRYLEARHGLRLAATSLIVPHGFSRRNVGAPAEKLSARDGETHLALVGTANPRPGGSRYYVEIIRRLTSLGFVVHSHFHEIDDDRNAVYRQLARDDDRYRYHSTVSFREATLLSELMSRYDLMGVFHELAAKRGNESRTLAVCMPTKAVCGWLHGGLPVVCSPHYGGVVEQIRALGIGFVADGWPEVGRLVGDHEAIAAATARVLAERDRFTNERNAERIDGFFRRLSAERRGGPSGTL